jgi:hypothetical protein
VVLERGSVEEPDRKSADRDDAEEDQSEGDVRLALWVVLGETVHQKAPTAALLDLVRHFVPSKTVVGRRCEQTPTAALLGLVELRGIEPLTS